MLHFPFSREFNALFLSDRHALLKIFGGGIVGAILSAKAFDRDSGLSTTAAIIVTAGTVIAAMIVVAVLMLRDVVRKRDAAGLPVSRVLKLYLCSGMLTLALWIFAAFSLAIVLAFTL